MLREHIQKNLEDGRVYVFDDITITKDTPNAVDEIIFRAFTKFKIRR